MNGRMAPGPDRRRRPDAAPKPVLTSGAPPAGMPAP